MSSNIFVQGSKTMSPYKTIAKIEKQVCNIYQNVPRNISVSRRKPVPNLQPVVAIV